MDEQKKPVGRPQIYQGWQPEQRNRRRTKPAQRPQEERRKGEYRPLAVMEQSLQMSPTADANTQPEKRIADQDIVRIPKTDLKKVTQMPVQKPEQRVLKQTNQPGQCVPQQINQKPVNQPGQRASQQINQKPVSQTERRMPQHEEQKKLTAAKRRRDQESEMKMRFLWLVFGLLCIALSAAIFYEIILGHGLKETGAERMEEQKQEQIVDTEEKIIEILTPGGELVSEIRERENRRSLPQQGESELLSDDEGETDTGEGSISNVR